MSVSTDGEISFGYVLEEGCELPWNKEEFDGDIDEWWRHVNGYVGLPRPFTDDGQYAPGFGQGDPRIEAYFKHRRDWDKANPVPVRMVNYCSADYPMWAITVLGAGTSCSRGFPEKFDPRNLVVTPEQIASLKVFCEKYGIEVEGDPKWILTSYWG